MPSDIMDGMKSLVHPYGNLSELLLQTAARDPEKPHLRFRAGDGINTTPRRETAGQSARCAAFGCQKCGILV